MIGSVENRSAVVGGWVRPCIGHSSKVLSARIGTAMVRETTMLSPPLHGAKLGETVNHLPRHVVHSIQPCIRVIVHVAFNSLVHWAQLVDAFVLHPTVPFWERSSSLGHRRCGSSSSGPLLIFCGSRCKPCGLDESALFCCISCPVIRNWRRRFSSRCWCSLAGRRPCWRSWWRQIPTHIPPSL